ncbi:unnamed protein product [Enterobius vermicularis]|uniref:SSD domain-containing protein n=1 Tax=Enterobius vermicularis TaxID=51028 RepID=A0A0N4VG63_ENTVE|nr:unnamed protein product [Enterobius vermicularis]
MSVDYIFALCDVKILTQQINLGRWIAYAPWTIIVLTCLLTAFCTSIIPFTEMTNDITDYTPNSARARAETKVYQEFFNEDGDPIAIYILVLAKNEGSIFGVSPLADTVRLLDSLLYDIELKSENSNLSLPFSKFCSSFCDINEPIRQNGLRVLKDNSSSLSPLIDLGYPETTVLGRRFYLDTAFFGIKIKLVKSYKVFSTYINVIEQRTVSWSVEVIDDKGQQRVMTFNEISSTKEGPIINDKDKQIMNNLKDVKIAVIQLRAKRPSECTAKDAKNYEFAVVDFIKKNFSSQYVSAFVFTPAYLTAEIVRTGLLMIPNIVIGFIIMCIFASTTVTISAVFMLQMNNRKIPLAIIACICPYMAASTALGALFWLGVRFGTILCVTPFLILAIGVDDSYLVINAWQRLNRSLRLYPERDAHGNPVETEIGTRLGMTLEDVGPSITITSLTNVLAFGIGILTPTPEIRLFCIGNTLAMIVDFFYQITFFTAVMAVMCRNEVENEKKMLNCKVKIVDNQQDTQSDFRNRIRNAVKGYCRLVCSPTSMVLVVALLILYWSLSLYGTITTHTEIKPEVLFIPDSDILQAIRVRNTYITPSYSPCLVFVNNPGNIDDPKNLRKLHKLVEAFESMPKALGRFSTKLWLRDYEDFVLDADQSSEAGSTKFYSGSTPAKENQQDILKFLEWPEFRYWNGTLKYRLDSKGNAVVTKFFFLIAFHGDDLKIWSNRAKLLKEVRQVADKFPEYEVSVYDEDAKFIDIIATLISQTAQSSACMLVCMVLVCLMFISHKTATAIASFSIASTTIGVFGFLSLWGVYLDPIVMSNVITSIGFSVDIPAHVTYHFFKAGNLTIFFSDADGDSVEQRFEHCLSKIAFPVLQAACSTLVCVISMVWIQLYMSIQISRSGFCENDVPSSSVWTSTWFADYTRVAEDRISFQEEVSSARFRACNRQCCTHYQNQP